MPSMNPDGFEYVNAIFPKRDNCTDHEGRYNRNSKRNYRDPSLTGKDLNRNFPYLHFSKTFDFENDINLGHFNYQEPESKAVTKWINNVSDNPFVLSISFHGGTEIVLYPYGGAHQYPDFKLTFSTLDEKLFEYLSLTYGKSHKRWKNWQANRGKICDNQKYNFTHFPIANTGKNLYAVYGGMGDYNYDYSNCLEIMVELSCCKFPPESQLNKEWNDNK